MKNYFYLILILTPFYYAQGQTIADTVSRSYYEYNIRGSESLPFLLTYINGDKITTYKDSRQHRFIKLFELPDYNSVYHIDREKMIMGTFFYVLINSVGGEATFGNPELKIFKTPSLLTPEIVKISDSKDSDYFIVKIREWFFDEDKEMKEFYSERGFMEYHSPLNKEVVFYQGERQFRIVEFKFPK